MKNLPYSELLMIIIGEKVKKDMLNTIVMDILILEEKLNTLEEQSFYFKKGLESKSIKLFNLKTQYNIIRNVVNNSNVEGILHRREELINKIQEFESGHKGFCQQVWLCGLKNNLMYIDQILLIKSKYEYLKTIEEYKNRPDELIEFFN